MCTRQVSYQKKILMIMVFLLLMSVDILAFRRVKEKDVVPPTAVEDMNGKTVKLSDYKDKKVVALLFWKHPSLRGEKALVFFQKLYDTYKEAFPFQVISVYVPQNDDKVTDEEMTDVKQIIDNNKITFPVLIDKGMVIFSMYGPIAFPSSALIDKDGVMIYKLAGLPEFFGEKDISVNVKKALGIKEEEKPKTDIAYKAKNNASYFLNLARQVHVKGNTSKAIDHTKLAIERDPDFAEAYAFLGSLYSIEKDYKKAIEAYMSSLKLDSTNSEVLLSYGFLCLESGAREDAILQFKNIININPLKAAEGHFGLGSIYYQEGIYDSAKVHQEKAIELYGIWKEFSTDEKIHHALAFYNLGEAYLKMGQKKEAISYFKQSTEAYNKMTVDLLRGKESMIDYSNKH